MISVVKFVGDRVRPMRREASVLSLVALVALAGCGGDEFAASKNESVLFSPLRTRSAVATVLEDPNAPATDGMEEIQAIVAEFEQGMTGGSQAAPNMVDLEAKFIQRGRYLDLIGIYQNMIQKNMLEAGAGEDGGRDATATGPIELRLARAYLRLGQERIARQMLDKMIVENADSPMTWFLNAAYWLPDAADSEEAAAQVVANWQKTLDIDPNFVGFDQPNVPSLKEQLAALRQRTPADKVASATAELHRKMNPNALEKTAQKQDETKEGADAPEEAEVAEVALVEPAKLAEAAVVATKTEAPKQATPVAEPPEQAGTPPAEKPAPQRIPYMMAHANMALAQENTAEATRLFEQVLARDAEHIGAQFGLVRAGWMNSRLRPGLEQRFRKLAERSDLKPREELEIGRFAYYNLQDRALAIKLWERVKKKDPALAKSVGVDALIEDAKRPSDSD